MYARTLDRPLQVRHSFFLFGPRGTGKTTWLKQRLPDALYLDLLDSALYVDLLARPQRLGELVPPAHDGWVVLDEIQRIPMLLNEVHRLIEARGIPFAMTGSSARSLRRRGVNLLAGRAHTYRMHPLTAGELGADFDPAAALRYGHLPAVRSDPDPDAYLASYVETYLREEVLQEGLTRNLAAFSRFLEAASFSQAAPLNVAAVARDAGMERRTVANYFQVLEDLLLAWRLPAFTRRAARRLTGHPKFFLFDAGVFRRLRPRGPLDRPEEIEGAGWETLLHQEVRAVNDYEGLGYALSYWRTGAGAEVDLVAYGERGLLAFEVKRTGRLRREDGAGLRLFARDYPPAKCFLLYGGTRREYQGGIEIWPLAEALRSLPLILSAGTGGGSVTG